MRGKETRGRAAEREQYPNRLDRYNWSGVRLWGALCTSHFPRRMAQILLVDPGYGNRCPGQRKASLQMDDDYVVR